MNGKITMTKPLRRMGDLYYFGVPKQIIDSTILSIGSEYKITIEEDKNVGRNKR